MKKRVLLAVVLQFFLVLNSCNSDSGDESKPTIELPVVVIKEAKVTSYSKNAGETGETVSIYGENFSDKVSDIKITFDGVVTTIVSASATEIKITLPQTGKVLPELKIIIDGKKAVNEVKNDYNQNIGILPVPSTSGWFAIENTLKSDKTIKGVQMISDKIFYYIFDSYVYRTLDGGISWNKWAYNYSNDGGFWATKNGDGLGYTLFGSQNSSGGVIKIPKEGDLSSLKNVWKEPGGAYPGIMSVFVDENMQDATIISKKAAVYSSSKGGNFELTFDTQSTFDSKDFARVYRGATIDNDHIWAIGERSESGVTYPFILFKNNTTDGWKQHMLKNESSSYFNEISFADTVNGFLLIRGASTTTFYKTINGGDTWSKVYNGEKFTKFTFKDANTGWAILDNKIYKTVDGASTWVLDYTNDQPIRTIAYKNNIVWAISTDKIIKRYL